MVTTYESSEPLMTSIMDDNTDGDYDSNVDVNDSPYAIIRYNPGLYFPDVAPPRGFDEKYDSDVEDHEYLKVGISFDAIQYLFPSRQSDYLIRMNEDGKGERLTAEYMESKRYAIICTFHIPVMFCPLAQNCCDMKECFSQLAKEKDDFVVVLVARMRSDFPNYDNHQVAEAAFAHFFSAFSPLCLAVPISDHVRSLNLFRVIGSSHHFETGLIIVDLEKRELLDSSIFDFLRNGPDHYPFNEERQLELKEEARAISAGKMPLETLLYRQSRDVLECVCNPKSPCGTVVSMSSLKNKVVGLYYLNDGRFLDKIRELYKLCKAKDLQFTIVVVCALSYRGGEPTIPSHWIDVVHSWLQNPDCCGWFLLPFDCRISRRLSVMCHHLCRDKLVVVGPNGSYVDHDGLEVFREYGIRAYPFTKQSACNKEVARLRSRRLRDWLSGSDIHSLQRPNGEILPVSDLRGRDVLVYFGSIDSDGKCSWDTDDRLLESIREMKTASKGSLELIFICLDDDDSTSISDHCCSEMGWLIPVPYKTDRNRSLGKSFRLGVWDGHLAAFNRYGRLLRVAMDRDLWHQSGPATFPESDDALPRDVRSWVYYQFIDYIYLPFENRDY